LTQRSNRTRQKELISTFPRSRNSRISAAGYFVPAVDWRALSGAQ
jgi:hypothetical protein